MWLQSLVAEFEAFEFKGVSATSSIAARFEMAAAVETVITEEAYTINIKTTAAAKLELKKSMIQLRLGLSAGDGYSFLVKRGESKSMRTMSIRTLV